MARYAVTTTILVEAVDANEAALIVERLLAGRFEHQVVAIEMKGRT